MSGVVVAAGSNSRLLLNRFEQAIALTLYCWFVWRLWPESVDARHAYAFLLVFSEGIVAALLLIRNPDGTISQRTGDWALALIGTCAPLLARPGGEPISILAGTAFLLLGLTIHVGAKLSLLRSFGLVAADRGIKVRGLYRIVRHPMYAGYMISHFGFLLAAPTLWNLVLYCCVWTVLLMRIFAEERILFGNRTYRDYADRVRYRLVPCVV